MKMVVASQEYQIEEAKPEEAQYVIFSSKFSSHAFFLSFGIRVNFAFSVNGRRIGKHRSERQPKRIR